VRSGVAGLNVTVPFKQDALDAVDPAPLAERIGAVNTVDFGPLRAGDADRPRGHNTDAAGVKRAFSHHDIELAGRDAVVVGAGGAGGPPRSRWPTRARRSTSRTAPRSGRSTWPTRGPRARPAGARRSGDRIAGADVLVNATSVGMDEPEATPVPADHLHGDLAVLDAVYAPIETRLLREAAAAGATTIDGAWMLLFQGVEAFESGPAPTRRWRR